MMTSSSWVRLLMPKLGTGGKSSAMSAPTNTAETMPITEPILLDEEVIDLDALMQQLVAMKAKNAKIVQKKRDHEAKEEREQKDRAQADRLTKEAKRIWKAEEANKKQVSAIEISLGLG